MVLGLLGATFTPIAAFDEAKEEETVTYNTDFSDNFHLDYNSEIYTVNIRVKGNWDLYPVEETYYRDEHGNAQYEKYDASWDEEDLNFAIDCGSSITAKIDKISLSHKKENDTLTAKICIKFKKASDSSKKIWRYKTVTMDVEQLEVPLVETVNE